MLKIILFFFTGGFLVASQTIKMEFPHFVGKSYDFIIFQGSRSQTVHQGIIPSDGKFILSIPKEYGPYRGMSRWLITGTEQGGGLDMVIPGHDFSVSCLSAKPDNGNIIYTGNAEVEKMNRYSQKQQEIFNRYDAMLHAKRAFTKTDENYVVFAREYNNQLAAYNRLQSVEYQDGSYPSEFLKIVNITLGIGTKLEETEEKRAENIADYITNELDWEVLYTSGHWAGVISSWIDIHMRVLKDDQVFVNDFRLITQKISRPGLYSDFAGRVAYLLTQQGKDRLIDDIAPIVSGSGKISRYEGNLSVYKRGGGGSIAPELILAKYKEGKKEISVLKSSNLAGTNYNKTLLVFYNSSCGACEKTLEELSRDYKKLLRERVRIIGISSDKEEAVFKKTLSSFPGNETYCDYEGVKGRNFTNYGVTGTPTLILVDKNGRIQFRGSELSEVNPKVHK